MTKGPLLQSNAKSQINVPLISTFKGIGCRSLLIDIVISIGRIRVLFPTELKRWTIIILWSPRCSWWWAERVVCHVRKLNFYCWICSEVLVVIHSFYIAGVVRLNLQEYVLRKGKDIWSGTCYSLMETKQSKNVALWSDSVSCKISNCSTLSKWFSQDFLFGKIEEEESLP